MSVADFNNDGVIDVAGSDADRNVVVHLSAPDGTRRRTIVIPASSAYSGATTTAADLNSDGRTDLLTLRRVQAGATGEVAVHPGNGDGTFGEPRVVARGDYLTFVVVADLTGDARPDIAVGQEPESVLMFPGKGDFSFGVHSVTTVGPWPVSAAAGDFNQDGRADLAVVSRYGWRVFLLLNQGTGSFGINEFATANWPWEVAAADLDNDGHTDLAVVASSEFQDAGSPPEGFVAVHLNGGNGALAAPVMYETGRGASGLTTGDFNGDGLPDVVTLNRSGDRFEGGLACGHYGGSDSVAVFTGTGSGALDRPAYFSLDEAGEKFSGSVRSLVAAHLNGDTRLDLLVAPTRLLLGRAPTVNRPPMAFAWEYGSPSEGHLRFASAASDADHDLLTYRWTDAAGAVVGGTLDRTCIEPPLPVGEHTYTLTVTDDQGASAVARFSVIIREADSPSVSFTAVEASVNAGAPYQITWDAFPAEATLPIGSFDLFTSVDGTTFHPIPGCAGLPGTARACTWHQPGPAGNVMLRIIVRGANGRISAAHMRAIVQEVNWTPPPAPWQSRDIGAIGAAGNAAIANGTYRVSGAGADIWGTADAFHYLYQPLPFDGDLTVRVASVSGPHVWTKAGVMIRESLTPGSRHVSIFVTPGKGVAYQRRLTTGGTTLHTTVADAGAPYFLRITRRDRFIHVFHSRDGINWANSGADTFDGAGEIFIGMAVTSHDASTLATGVFDQVSTVIYPPNTPPTVRITTPANGATFRDPADIMIVADAADADTGLAMVQFQMQTASGWSGIGTRESAPWSIVWSNVRTGTYTLRAVATDRRFAQTASTPVTVTVTDGPIEGQWTSQDIGAVAIAGRFADGDPVTVEGSGADIWGTADAFHYAWREMSGNFQIVARVASIENVHAWTKAGLMIRDHTGASSRHVSLFASAGRGIAFQRRLSDGGITTHTDAGVGFPPIWLKLARVGNTVFAYRSPNGIAWYLVASQAMTLPAAVKVGLAVTSHDNMQLATATFSHVAVTALGAWTSRDIGAGGVAGTTTGVDPLAIEGPGADIWGTADAFRFVYKAWTGDGEVIAQVTSVENTNVWAKAGVMIRGGLEANAAHLSLFVTPGKGVALQSRAATGDLTTHASAAAATAPYWVRLVRRGATITAATSPDGANWTTAGSRSIALGETIFVGLAVTSHDNATLCTATFQSAEVRR